MPIYQKLVVEAKEILLLHKKLMGVRKMLFIGTAHATG
jgi:hypothetical protein